MCCNSIHQFKRKRDNLRFLKMLFLSNFRTNYYLFLPLNSVCLTRKQQISIVLSLVSSDLDSNSRTTELEASSLAEKLVIWRSMTITHSLKIKRMILLWNIYAFNTEAQWHWNRTICFSSETYRSTQTHYPYSEPTIICSYPLILCA
jgi:hypothetical protein